LAVFFQFQRFFSGEFIRVEIFGERGRRADSVVLGPPVMVALLVVARKTGHPFGFEQRKSEEWIFNEFILVWYTRLHLFASFWSLVVLLHFQNFSYIIYKEERARSLYFLFF
tara:strand:- start:339 stop:674 length:336 start_codon:yes stop_codon:yes gene_type:complete